MPQPVRPNKSRQSVIETGSALIEATFVLAIFALLLSTAAALHSRSQAHLMRVMVLHQLLRLPKNLSATDYTQLLGQVTGHTWSQQGTEYHRKWSRLDQPNENIVISRNVNGRLGIWTVEEKEYIRELSKSWDW